ncbi:DNA-binding domain-containing protein [Stenotrophomonas sp. GZD-301]|uniref:HvfC family RiPP maturation protein n=1 Tax=Stenotrophomonas sp. GZD-301 TaxID=3404814 RepID=UPI003BB6EE38
MADTSPRLHAQQRAFTAHLRDPERVAAPAGLDPRRLGIYRRLVFNNVLGLLGNGFPVCARLLGEEAWSALVGRFLADHRAQTPLFTELAAEFVQWLQAHPALPHPALAELAHYEWVETALYQLDARPLPVATGLDPLGAPLQRSPLAWPLLYHWPVHRLGSADAPLQPPADPTGLLVRRDPDGQVRFATISPLAAHLLERIGQQPGQTGGDHLQALAQAHGLPGDALLTEGAALLQQFLRHAVIGPSPPPA